VERVTTLAAPFAYEFFRNGFVVAGVAGALCALVGCWVVLRGMSAIGHGLSHAVLAGFAVASLAGVSTVVGAGVWGLGAALAIGRVARRTARTDAAIAVVTTTSFAVGLVLLQRFGSPNRDPEAVLFGNVLGVSRADVALSAVVAAAVAAAVALRYRALLFVAFDPEVAAVSGVRVGRLDALLMIMLTVAVLASMKVLGVTLVAAAVVTPAATARLLTHRATRMVALAVGLGTVAALAGMVTSYHLDVAPGPVIVLVGGGAFASAYAWRAVRDRPLAGHRVRPGG
jgi:ABC-type Mn2+/Zn2+ transport system permease subunit